MKKLLATLMLITLAACTNLESKTSGMMCEKCACCQAMMDDGMKMEGMKMDGMKSGMQCPMMKDGKKDGMKCGCCKGMMEDGTEKQSMPSTKKPAVNHDAHHPAQ